MLEAPVDPTTGLTVPVIVCATPHDGEVDNGLLLGMQDTNNDGRPEPLQVVGFAPALTAGFAQGTGFVTLAFNNDITLNPLPVSLNVIRVECLQIGRPTSRAPTRGRSTSCRRPTSSPSR